jgi:hypothetical protein
MQSAFFGHAKLFFGIAKICKSGMKNPFSGLQFTFLACNVTFQDCENDPPKNQFKNPILIFFQFVSSQWISLLFLIENMNLPNFSEV